MIRHQRLEYFDTIKGIAIILVVMGHVLTMCIRDIDNAFAFKIIGEIHMPLFFFISGFFTYRFTVNKLFKFPNLYQRFKQLIIPFIVISALWLYYFPHSGLKSPLPQDFEGLYSDPWKSGYWFTLCLFEIIALYGIISLILNCIKNKYIQIAIIITTCFLLEYITLYILPSNVVNNLSLSLTAQFFPIFMFGIIARRFQNDFFNTIDKSCIFTVNIIVCSFTLYAISYYWEFSWLTSNTLYFMRIILHITLASIAINVVKNTVETLHKNYIINSLKYLGRESLAIYLLHYFLLFPLDFLQTPLIKMGLGFTPCIFVATFVAIIIISIVLVINNIISRSKFLSLILTGKIK